MSFEISKFMVGIIFWIALGVTLGFLLLMTMNLIELILSKTKYWKETIQLAQEMRAIKSKERRTINR